MVEIASLCSMMTTCGKNVTTCDRDYFFHTMTEAVFMLEVLVVL